MPDEEIRSPDAATPSARARTWDYSLTAATVIVLALLGVQSFLGTLWAWWAQSADPAWEQAGQPAFIAGMNAFAAPLVAALVVLMGLCVPKRLISRAALVWTSAAMLAAGVAAWLASGDVTTGLAAYLGLASLIQVAVAALTIAGVRGPSYLTEGRLTKTGSALLHLGFILFAIVVVALQRSAAMLPVFWAASVLIMGGTMLSFYADRLAVRHVVATVSVEEDRIRQESPAEEEPGHRESSADEE